LGKGRQNTHCTRGIGPKGEEVPLRGGKRRIIQRRLVLDRCHLSCGCRGKEILSTSEFDVQRRKGVTILAFS